MTDKSPPRERLDAADERMRKAAKRLHEANAELDAAEKEHREACEQVIREAGGEL